MARQALISGRLVQLAIVSVIQSLIVITLGLLAGAHFPGGVTGLTVQPWTLKNGKSGVAYHAARVEPVSSK